MNRFSQLRLVGALVAFAPFMSGCWSHTPQIHFEKTDNARGRSVAELSTIRLGGVNQWVLVRGDTTRPVLLFLHGGPGMSTMYLAHEFQTGLERQFVVVQWDRRGAGKSYAARFPVESLTVRRTLADLFELTAMLRQRFHTEKIYLVAHSWGTYLGMLAVREHPEWYFAYVGMGQMVPDTAQVHNAQRECVQTEATAHGDSALRARMAAKYGSGSARVSEGDMFAAGGELHARTSMWPIIRSGLHAPEYSLVDAMHVQKGAQFVGAHMRDDVDAGWMRERPRFTLPIALFLGRHDCNTPSNLAASYLNSIDAPLKQLVWFENSAHFPFWEEPHRFTEEMVRLDSTVRMRRGAPEPSHDAPRPGSSAESEFGQITDSVVARAESFLQQKDWTHAALEYERLTRMQPHDSSAWLGLGIAYHEAGRLEDAERALQRAADDGTPGYAPYWRLARIRAVRGDAAGAVRNLEMVDQRSRGMPPAAVTSVPDFAGLRDDPGFKAFVDKLIAFRDPCLSDPRNHQLDFWIGKWNVLVGGGRGGSSSEITELPGHCAIMESWTDATGSRGQSINFFDPGRGKWRQIWVDEVGSVIDFEGTVVNAEMRFEGTSVGRNGGPPRARRMLLTPVAADTVRQTTQDSPDGKTWTTTFVGIYGRRPQ